MTYCVYCRLSYEGHLFIAREMMFGSREQFEYSQCPQCKSCMLTTPLESFNLSSHYPTDYYSFTTPIARANSVTAFLKRKRGQHLLGQPNMVGAIMQLMKPFPDFPQITRYGINVFDSVLDVGSGNGRFLTYLKENGFHGFLCGCDPYIPKAMATPDFEIKKCSILDIDESYNIIFFNHSFEHLVNPLESIAAARSLQKKDDGRCIIRIPTTSSLAFQRYGANWVQLDPPRHISVPSREGMRMMAGLSGYSLEAMIDDSSAFQFWASEQYARDIPLRAHNSYDKDPQKSIFSESEIAEFEREAKTVNALNQGDQTAFVLRAV